MTSTARWKQRPQGSNWGDFGPDDQLGKLNLLDAATVRQAVREVHEGRTFCLSLPLDYPGGSGLSPRRHPPVLRPTLQDGKVLFNYRMEDVDPDLHDVFNDDAVVLHLQYSTQWDSLAHVGHSFDVEGDGVARPVFYNGYRSGEHMVGPSDPGDAGMSGITGPRSTSAARALGVEHMAEACIQGRGVMVDLRFHLGDARAAVGYDQLMRIMEADQVEVETGDILCLHTGFAQLLLDMDGVPDVPRLAQACAALDGHDRKLLQWISDSGVVALVSDNQAVEQFPAHKQAGCCALLPLHEHCLFKQGIYLGELWYLSALADWLRKHGRNRFLLTAPPLRLPGAVGSPVTPVATV
jgi:kynurenine formamidase